jgi:hypothetical protein
MRAKFCLIDMKGYDDLGDLVLDGRVTLSCTERKKDVMGWTEFHWLHSFR